MCEARQTASNEWCCDRCGYSWDADDTAPECLTVTDAARRAALDKIYRGLSDD